MRLAEAIDRFAPDMPAPAMECLRNRGFLNVPVRFNSRLRSSLGRYLATRCGETGKETPVGIELNPKLQQESHEQLTRTFLHEIAHLIAGVAAGHGHAWKAATRLVGMKNATRFT